MAPTLTGQADLLSCLRPTAGVCCASDAQAAYVKARPVHPADICATIYHCLGIDPADRLCGVLA